MSIRSAIIQIVKPLIKPQLIKCKVVEVELPLCTVEPLNGEAAIFDVQLKAIENDLPAMIVVPKVGSDVVVGMINLNDEDWCVVQYSEIDKVIIEHEAGDVAFELNSDGISLGSLNESAEPALLGDTTQQQLNIERQRVDGIINALTSAGTGAADGGAAFKAAVVAAISGLQSPDYSQIKSQKVTLD